MRAAAFVCIVLASGAAAGAVQGAAGIALAGPHLDAAVAEENRALFSSGQEEDTPEFGAQHAEIRRLQYAGHVIGGVVVGTSSGALFGIVYGAARRSLPGGHDVKRALVLAGVMWLVLFAVPFLKYPPSLPGGGDPGEGGELRPATAASFESDAADQAARGASYAAMVAASGLAALASWILAGAAGLSGRGRLLASAAAYAAAVAAASALLPGGGGGGDAGFLAASAASVTAFWIAAPLVLGSLWHRFRPDAPRRAPAR